MRIGYPCINRSLDCTPNRTFRLASYTPERLFETVSANMTCLRRVLEYNVAHGLYAFRIGSGIVPFASHPVCRANWQGVFAEQWRALGTFATAQSMRLSMHPDQFIVLNSPREDVVARSVAELHYHAAVLDAMRLPQSAKIQLHLGGVYGNKAQAIARFIAVYRHLPRAVRRRLVIENDDRCYALSDCMHVYERIGIPVVLDTFHHECLNQGEPLDQAAAAAARTWRAADGPLMVDYSSQKAGARPGSHIESIVETHFRGILEALRGIDCDMMLEIKDKERSALRALALITRGGRHGVSPPS